MQEMKITLELGPDTRAWLAELFAGGRVIATPATAPSAAADATENSPADVAPAAPEQTTPARVVTHKDILDRVTELIRAGKKTEAREIVTAYAPGVSTIPADKCVEVMDKLDALYKQTVKK